MLSPADLLIVAGTATLLAVGSSTACLWWGRRHPPANPRLDSLLQDHQWVRDVKHQEITESIVTLQNRVNTLEATVPTVPGALTVSDLQLDQRMAQLEHELQWHQQTKHGELEQGFARLEGEITTLQRQG